jgi:hypothetical protein
LEAIEGLAATEARLVASGGTGDLVAIEAKLEIVDLMLVQILQVWKVKDWQLSHRFWMTCRNYLGRPHTRKEIGQESLGLLASSAV